MDMKITGRRVGVPHYACCNGKGWRYTKRHRPFRSAAKIMLKKIVRGA